MLHKLEPRNTMIGLLALYFVLGYLVGKTSDSAPGKAAPAAEATSAPTPAHAGTTTPAASTTHAAPAQAATSLPQPAVALQPAVTPQPAVAPQPVAVAPTPPPARPTPVAPAPTRPAPQPAAVATPPRPTPTPAPAAPAAAVKDQLWRVTVHKDDAQMGAKDALATVVFFSSFGCNTCQTFHDAPRKLLEKYPGKVRVHWKHKVVPPQHPDALDASVAALAAKRQGDDKFWDFHDRVFQNNAIDSLSLENAANAIGLDMDKWKADRKDPALRQQVLRDSLVANEVGAHSMPNILVNGLRMPKPKSWNSLVATVDKALAKAKERVAAGTKPDRLYLEETGSAKFFEQLGAQVPPIQTGNSAKIGPDDATVKVVVFEDFECPFCAKIGGAIKSFQALYPDQVQFVFKHMPLTSIHPQAMLASEAAMAAHRQGKFWEYHDLLFQNQKALGREDLERYAQQVGLEMEPFKKALDSGQFKAVIQNDLNEGNQAGVSGTPSVFLNGRRYQGPRGYPPEGLEAVSVVYLGLGPKK